MAAARLLAIVLLASMPACRRESPPSGNPGFELNYERLAGPLGMLTRDDRKTVSDTVELIKLGQHSLALVRLNELKEKHPQNSSLRILASYALLQAGNFLGAFDEAEKAHAASDGDAYRCWFLGKVALLSGNSAVCERELGHLEKAGDLTAEAKGLQQELGKN